MRVAAVEGQQRRQQHDQIWFHNDNKERPNENKLLLKVQGDFNMIDLLRYNTNV